MKFSTANSLYEVNPICRQIRRLNGVNDPTPRQGVDGEWKHYEELENLTVGKQALIIWEFVGGVAKATETSVVVNINNN